MKKNLVPAGVTHDGLADMAAKWLRRRGVKNPKMDNYYGVGLVTVNNHLMYNTEYPDVIGFTNDGILSVVIEVKISRADFKHDAKKTSFRRNLGMGNFRYYCCPEGLIRSEELPAGWGLLYCRGKKVFKVADAVKFTVIDSLSERYLLIYYLRYHQKLLENRR